MAAVMLGEGEAMFQGELMPGGAALAAAGLSPVIFGPKEGLALINGTQFLLLARWRHYLMAGGMPVLR